MSTKTRPELARKNKYWMEKHRYYELKHFCLQYPIWKKAYQEIDGLSKTASSALSYTKGGDVSDPTERAAETLIFLSDRMEMIEKVCLMADEVLAPYILKAVTEERSYEYLRVNLNIPCGKDSYYELYRKFFWLLDKERK